MCCCARAPSAKSHRAVATTYLHALWVGASTFDELREYGHEFREAYMLVKLWATIYATGEAMVEGYRRNQKVKQITIGDGPKQVSVAVLEQKINAGSAKVIALKSESGEHRQRRGARPVRVQVPDGQSRRVGDSQGAPAGKRSEWQALCVPRPAVGSQAVRHRSYRRRQHRARGAAGHLQEGVPGEGGVRWRLARSIGGCERRRRWPQSGLFGIASPEQDPAVLLASQLAQMQATFTANTEVMTKQLALMAKQVEALKKAQKEPNRGGIFSA